MRHRRALAIALGVVTAAVAAVPAVRHVMASAPANGFLPDFSQTFPGPQTLPNGWALQVSTGGVDGGQRVTMSFLYNGKPGDKAHAVTFNQLDPGEIAANQDIAILTLPAPPGGLTPQAVSQGCTAGQRGSDATPHSVEVDPYAQTLTVVMSGHEDAGTILFFCFTSGGLVGFPTTSGPGYSIRYTESGNGSTDIAYTVQPQSASQTTTAQVLDADGSDATDAGLAGSRPLVYGNGYPLNVSGATPGGIFGLRAEVYDASSDIQDAGAKVVFKERGQGCALPQDNQLCDPGTGVATGTVKVTSTAGRVDYVAITISPSVGATSATNPLQKIPSLIILTVGPPNATPPAAQATPTPQPSGGGTGGGPAPFDRDCPVNHVAPAHGVGSHDVLDALARVLIPDADAMCPDLSSKLSYVGANDALGLAKTLECGSPYAFAGLDRVLTTQEQSNYTQGCFAAGMQQFPILVDPVVVTYNLDAPGCSVNRVNLRSQILSAIFTGTITNWGDQKLLLDNPGLQNCHLPILVAHDLGPATVTFKDYLSKRNSHWSAYSQPQLVDAWPGLSPVSCTANGSEAMALCVEGQPGMIGYGFYRAIEAAGLPIAAVDDPSATFQASPLDPATGCTAAAGSNPFVPTAMDSKNWTQAPSITDTPLAYPICSFDFVLVPDHCTRQVASYSGVKAFLGAVYTRKAQGDLVAQGFASLPSGVMTNAQTAYENQAQSQLQC